MSDQPVLPYPDAVTGMSSGWSGSETSADRAHIEDSTGVTAQRQRETVRLVRWKGKEGLTWLQLAQITGMHHGSASGALSRLHRAGQIARLTEKRGRSAIYVLPEHVQGRETSAQGRQRQAPDTPLLIKIREVATRYAEGTAYYNGYDDRGMLEILALIEGSTEL